jgi:DNA repair protein RecN (Recombination protein N)
MLKSLHVKNYALIEEAMVEFREGLNLLTGETGAGKSILIDALGLLLGDRASSDCVRQGSERAIVEGVFAVGGNERAGRILNDNGYEGGEELIIRREISARGTSRTFLNDSPAPLTLLKEIGDHLVDLHGQHEHQMLLRADTHIDFLDDAGGLFDLVEQYRTRFHELQRMQSELRDLRGREMQLRERQEFYLYQLREIDAVGPEQGEDEAIVQELKLLENSERIAELGSGLVELLYEDQSSIHDQLQRARHVLDQLVAIDPSLKDYRAELTSAIAIVDELAKFFHGHATRIEFSPAKLEELRDRLHALNGLRKKFGGTLDAVLAYRATIAAEIELAQNFDEQIAQLESRLAAQRRSTGEIAARLSRKRRDLARKIERAVVDVLRGLGIEKGTFVIKIDQTTAAPGAANAVEHDGTLYAASPSGIDRVEFFISTNLGEEPKPLAKVASGGEISRVMLALKTILAKGERLPLLVFDEIDTGISGRVASKVGTAMRDLGAFHQIIAITHLPQIAAMSMNHYLVEKRVQGGRTVTMVRRLQGDEHVREVAKLMSGEVVTDASLQMARELIES